MLTVLPCTRVLVASSSPLSTDLALPLPTMAVGQFRDKEAHAYTTEHETDRYSDPIGVLVKPKWRGTEQDKTDMDVLGRGQVLRVRRHACCMRSLLTS